MDENKLKEIIENHKKWLDDKEGGEMAYLHGADLHGADLHGADLRWADLRGANLRGADLDYSCLPMWCGGSRFKCSPALIRQIFAHVTTLICEEADDELKAALSAIKGEAKKSHRARDLGLLEDE